MGSVPPLFFKGGRARAGLLYTEDGWIISFAPISRRSEFVSSESRNQIPL